MSSRKFIFLFIALFSLSFNAIADTNNLTPCPSKEACLNDPDALCWCSQICNWRKKAANDHPVYIENDPFGKFCYCKQWDYDNYEANCIKGLNIKQPPGAQ